MNDLFFAEIKTAEPAANVPVAKPDEVADASPKAGGPPATDVAASMPF